MNFESGPLHDYQYLGDGFRDRERRRRREKRWRGNFRRLPDTERESMLRALLEEVPSDVAMRACTDIYGVARATSHLTSTAAIGGPGDTAGHIALFDEPVPSAQINGEST